MTTSSLHLELLIGGRVSTPSASPIGQGIAVRESPMPFEPNVMNPFARRPLGVPLTRIAREGLLAIFAGLALIFAGVLFG